LPRRLQLALVPRRAVSARLCAPDMLARGRTTLNGAATPNERTPGATFPTAGLGWIDFETRSGSTSIQAGTDRYARNAQAVILAWAIGDGSVQTSAVADFARPLRWAQMPAALRRFYDRAAVGKAWFVAHNATFDRMIWDHATDGFPPLRPDMIIDTRVQATASGLPADLNQAAKYVGLGGKHAAGRALIKLFCLPESTATPQSHPNEWAEFIAYAAGDIDAMRGLFLHTRQLPLAEWREYWTAEIVNARGCAIDLGLAQAAATMADYDRRHAGRELSELTNGQVTTVDQVARMIAWLAESLPSEGRDILIKKYEEVDPETGAVLKPEKRALARDRVLRLLAYLVSLEPLPAPLLAAQRLLQIRLYGGSKTPAKFSKMMNAHVDGVLRAQYVFGGAPQTGRFSSKNVQIHNLMRDALPFEIDAIDALLAGASPANFAQLGDTTPISRKLSMLIRPTLVTRPGKAFVWGDWSQIEARLPPWLADDPEATKRLEVFTAVDRDPSIPDIYVRTAAAVSGVPIEAVDKALRQRGKVVELACGFLGSTNALLSMAASYGLHLEPAEAKQTVERWNEENPWARRFGGRHDWRGSYGLWGALNRAIEAPGQPVAAGRVSYVYLRDYLGGSLLCMLPSGRCLTYRRIKWERVDVLDEDSGEIVDVRSELMFSREHGRQKLWPGMCVENVTQAAAADCLRAVLRRLEENPEFAWMPVVLHTHDELVLEVDEARADAAAEILLREMERDLPWSAGLPLKAEATIARWYSKSRGSLGL
jgi:DNA polymerase bacteriophage-type